jgi:hypothetical protein
MNQTFQEFWSKNKKIFQLLRKQKGINHYQALWEARSQELEQLKHQNDFLQNENTNLLKIRIESEKLIKTLAADLVRAQDLIERQNNNISDMKSEMEKKEFLLLRSQAELELANIYQKKMRQFNSQMENNLVEKQRQLESLL